MMKKKDIRHKCPASEGYSLAIDDNQVDPRCNVCRAFINLKYDYGCPCLLLGEDTAIQRTKAALKRKGYLK
jgi:hypothetical protein